MRLSVKPEVSLEQRIEYLNAIRQAQQKIQSLRTVLKKETQFNHKVELNIKIKQNEQQLKQIIVHITGE